MHALHTEKCAPKRQPSQLSEMFTTSPTPFLDHASDLYQQGAFACPAASVAAPPAPADWVSYEGPPDIRSPQYQQFRSSPLFPATHQQWLDRVDDCERIARDLCSGMEARQVLDALEVFRQRLRQQWGESFATSNMPLLFGEGKRAMDRICQRLAQQELPADFRRLQLREMASHLHLCMATGPAFIQAARALDTAPDGLRSAFLQVSQRRADQVCRDIFQLEQQGHQREEWQAAMEVHAVNRFRIVYQLPGADPTDIHSRGPSLLVKEHQPFHLSELRRVLDPVQVAEALADQYWDRLIGSLPPSVPPRTSRTDLNAFMPDISKAIQHMNVAMAPVSMTSLLAMDDATDAVHWQTDSSLLALELLAALEGEAIVAPQARQSLLAVQEPERTWTLTSVRDGLFHILETPRGAAQPFVQPVRLEHASIYEECCRKASRSFPVALVDTVIRGEVPEHLGRIPVTWLTDERQIQHWLRRVDTQCCEAWIRAHPSLPFHMVPTMCRALTEMGRGDLLASVLRLAPASSHRWLVRRGLEVLEVARNAMDPDTQAVWRRHLPTAFEQLGEDLVNQLLYPGEVLNLLHTALATGRAHPVALAADLLRSAVSSRAVRIGQLPPHLDVPLQSAMQKGHLEALQVLGEFLREVAEKQWCSRLALTEVLGGRHPGRGCKGAMLGGQDDCLRWYLALVLDLHHKRGIGRDALMRLVVEPCLDHTVLSHYAVARGHSSTLAVYLNWLIDRVQDNIVPSHALIRQLYCSGHRERGLVTLLEARDRACLDRWCEALIRAHQAGWIQSSTVMDLLACRNENDAPLLQELLRSPNAAPLNHWFHAVATLATHHALEASQVTELLESRQEVPLLHHPAILRILMLRHHDPVKVRCYIEHLAQLHEKGVLTGQTLEHLLSGCDPRQPLPSLVAAIHRQRARAIRYFLEGLVPVGQEGRLSSAALIRVLAGRVPEVGHRVRRDCAIVAAIRRRDVETLTLLINASLVLSQQGAITTEDWVTLLEPQNAAESPLAVLHHVNHAESLAFVRNTLITANGMRLLSKEKAERLLAPLHGLD